MKNACLPTVAGKLPIKVSIFKLSWLLLTLCITNIYAEKSYSQATLLSLELTKKTIKEAFTEIEQKSEYIFFYHDNVVDLNRRVSLSVKNKPITEILDLLFKATDNSYIITDRQVFISKKEAEKTTNNTFADDKPAVFIVKGNISDANSVPLAGAIVVVKNNPKIGTTTDADGNYTLQSPSAKATLQFRYLGYQEQEEFINSRPIINIVLHEESGELEEVVVVGFGTQKKESVIGAIQSVKASELKLPTTNLTNNFAGRIAGIISVQKSGEPGADGANFWIRGIGTFAGGRAQTPLILIDGIESSSYDLNAIAPEVIESFSVLKDATATALYGSRGANGVMLITTKSGRDGKPLINARVEGRVSMPTQKPKLADGLTFMRMFNEAIESRTPGASPQFSLAQIEGVLLKKDPYIYPDVDWYDTMFKDNAFSQAANLNVSGGTKKMDYFMSATLNSDEGMVKMASENPFQNNIQNLRYSFQANVNSYITNTTKLGVKLNVQVQDYKGPYNSINTIFKRVMWSQPSYFPIKYPQIPGTDYTAFGNQSGGAQLNRYPNPYAELSAGIDEMFRTTTMATFSVDQDLKQILPGLSVKGMFSLKNFNSTTTKKYLIPHYFELDKNSLSYDEDTGLYDYDLKAVNTDGTNSVTASNSFSGDRLINITASIDYSQVFNKIHDVSAQLIYLQRGSYKNNPSSSNYNDALGELNQGIAGRLTYDFEKRYFIEFNFGYNGSDNFASGKRFGFFPSYAVGYILSNESFFEPLSSSISLLKLRASYGKVGNSISSYRFPGYSNVNMSGGGYIFGENYNNSATGAIVTKYGNEDATWEIAKKLNLGLEVGLLNHKILLIADWFYEDRDNILMERESIPSTTGIGNARPLANIGRVTNKGIDMSLEVNHAFQKDVILSVKGNLTYAVNKLMNKDEPFYPWPYQYEKGGPLNRVGPAYIALGLFKDEADIAASPDQTGVMPNIKPGDIKYKDLNGDDLINEYDKTYIGDPYIPQLVYGFGASFRYKKWDYSLFFQGVDKVSIYLDNIHPFDIYHQNVLQFVADNYWSEANPNPNAKYPRLAHNVDNTNTYQKSTFWLRNGDFLRLKNAEVGFSHSFFRAYLSGSNLLTLTNFKFWDPEIGGGSNEGNGLVYPLQRVINLGIQFKF